MVIVFFLFSNKFHKQQLFFIFIVLFFCCCFFWHFTHVHSLRLRIAEKKVKVGTQLHHSVNENYSTTSAQCTMKAEGAGSFVLCAKRTVSSLSFKTSLLRTVGSLRVEVEEGKWLQFMKAFRTAVIQAEGWDFINNLKIDYFNEALYLCVLFWFSFLPEEGFFFSSEVDHHCGTSCASGSSSSPGNPAGHRRPGETAPSWWTRYAASRRQKGRGLHRTVQVTEHMAAVQMGVNMVIHPSSHQGDLQAGFDWQFPVLN